jgi:hypothetical protein
VSSGVAIAFPTIFSFSDQLTLRPNYHRSYRHFSSYGCLFC